MVAGEFMHVWCIWSHLVNENNVHVRKILRFRRVSVMQTYGTQFESFDAICSCFFLDTAHNILDYLQLIAQLLSPGGILY